MPFDPAVPATNAELTSAMFRGQFLGLKLLIDAIQSIIAAQVDGVTTLNPGDPAAVTVSTVGDTLHFSFAIPRGNDGTQGAQGIDGVQGPPFAQALIDTVNTLNPGENASVSVSFDGTNVHFTFGIPRGADGPQGIQGPPVANAIVDAVNTLSPGEPATAGVSFDGTSMHFTFGLPRGGDGTNGTNGEVSNAQLETAISGTSSNTNAVATLDTPFTNDPASLADMGKRHAW